MPKYAALALFVVLVIVFSYRLGRHAAERATPGGEPVAMPAPVVASPPPPPSDAAARKGATWGVAADLELPVGSVFVGCHGEPATDAGSCNVEQGDTACTTALPLLCLKIDGTAMPTDLPERADDARWIGGTVATTAPIRGTELTSRAKADKTCVAEFGDGWRLAGSDAGAAGAQAGGSAVENSGASPSPSIGARDVTGFYAAGDPIMTSRFWVAIGGRPANCWDR